MILFYFVRAITKYVAPYRGLIGVLVLGVAVEAAFETGLRYSLKYLVDVAVPARNVGTLLSLLGLLAAGALVYTVASLLCDYLWARVGSLVMKGLKR